MAKLKLISGLTAKDSTLVIKETGEIIQRVKSVTFTSNIDTGENETIIVMYPIDIEVDESRIIDALLHKD